MPDKLSDKPTGRSYTPTRSYDLQLSIKLLDYSADLVAMTVNSSLSTGYQVVELVLSLDPTDIIFDELYGESPIKLSITLLAETEIPGPRVQMNLMYLKSDFKLDEREEMSKKNQKNRIMYTVTTVTKEPYYTFSSMVNDVFIGENLRTILESLVFSVQPRGLGNPPKLLYDSDGENTSPIDQVCIPPTTLYKVIKEYNRMSDDIFDGFLDQRFGLFNGTPGVFCQFDNTIYIKNLTAKMTKNQAFTMYHLALDADKQTLDRIFAEVYDLNTSFYTYDIVDTDYSGNARFATIASNLNHIVKPKNSLFNIINQDLKTVGTNYSLTYKTNTIPRFPIDPNVERTRYFNQDTGYENEQTIFNSRFGRSLADLSALSLNLERNLPVLPLLNVGECVKYKPLTLEYQDLEGKYILWSSSIRFVRGGASWNTTCRVNLVRTNKTK